MLPAASGCPRVRQRHELAHLLLGIFRAWTRSIAGRKSEMSPFPICPKIHRGPTHRPKSQINRRTPGHSPPSRSRPGLSTGSTVRQTPAALHHDGDENLKDYIAAEEQE